MEVGIITFEFYTFLLLLFLLVFLMVGLFTEHYVNDIIVLHLHFFQLYKIK